MRIEDLTVKRELVGLRLDKGVSLAVEHLSRSMVQNLCQEGKILHNGKPADKNTRLALGDQIHLQIPDPVAIEALPEAIPLDIVYEDAWLLVVNKPKGMVVHPAPGNPDHTLVNALLAHCQGSLSGIGGAIRPGIVHRIDKDTSGLLIVAKNDQAHQELSRQIREHTFAREYAAVVHGHLKEKTFTVDAPIGRSPVNRKKMCVTQQHSKPAVTHVEVLEEYPGFSYIACRLETGRTHQIRVHMSYIGHPVVGDPVYGPAKAAFSCGGQCLHARTIGFVHPATGEKLFFSSELPEYFIKVLNTLKARQ